MPSGQPPLRRSRYPPDESGILPSKNIITRRLKSLFRMRFPGPFLPGLVLLLLLMPVFKVHGFVISNHWDGILLPYQGGVKFRLDSDKDKRLDIKMCRGSSEAKYLGTGTPSPEKRSQCEGHFYLYKHSPKGRKKQAGQSVNAKIIGRFSPFLMSAIGH